MTQASDQQLTAAASNAGHLLQTRGLLVVTAESCTAGWIAKLLTDSAGSSAWLERGFVTYSNCAKHELLGVSEQVLRRFGAVSRETVAAMALGALAASRAQVAVSVSGIAGPGGGSEAKPVGTVWLGWRVLSGAAFEQEHHLPGDRDAVRRQAAMLAFAGLHDVLERTAV